MIEFIIMALFLNLLLAHLLGDFVFQTDDLCEKKRKEGLCSLFMWIHPLIVAAFSWLLYGGKCFLWGAIIIFVSHLLIDAFKSRLERKQKQFYFFVLDQFLHLLIIGMLCWLYGEGWNQFGFIPEKYNLFAPAILCAAILCTKPANIMIKGILDMYKIKVSDNATVDNNDLKNAGALIGSVERIVILILIILGQYEAVGFVIAAKSLLRFKDSDGAKSEYVLVGTLLSLCVVMVCTMGVMVLCGKYKIINL